MDNPAPHKHRAPVILVNKAQCKRCGDVIESTHRHDFVLCRCRAIGVDGGHDYLRRLGEPQDIIELARYRDQPTVEDDGLLPLRAVAAQTGYGTAHLVRLIRQGRLPAIKRGRRWFVTFAAVERYRQEGED